MRDLLNFMKVRFTYSGFRKLRNDSYAGFTSLAFLCIFLAPADWMDSSQSDGNLQVPIEEPVVEVISASGTGRTTGHIATLLLRNATDTEVTIQPCAYYIPSEGKFQSYIARIEVPLTIPSGRMVSASLFGYCIDVHSPPVPANNKLPDFNNWVAISDSPSESVSTYILLPGFVNRPIPDAWTFDYLEDDIVQDYPGNYTPPIMPLLPGNGIPVGGTVDLDRHPQAVAPVLLDILESIESAAKKIQGNSQWKTPFSNNLQLEYESLVQQTFWITTSSIEGKKYGKDEFAANITKQYREQGGDDEDKEISEGIDQFWAAFSAIGIEAKVLSGNSPGLNTGSLENNNE